ncbi:hypothetical protein N568_0105035 [Lactococcus garvieae TRF1]|uniref:histidine kinase n=1 Tax=Lactococcus garvieae TRF1 TaxID=1380772 RepID=V8AQQ2_9LACT|nr:hypothetical protein N568_0105035 [Lactococcus garvieae TRF1]
MVKVPFNVDSSTARIIGRENISGLRGALFELIKNSYDADARISFLYYHDNTLFIGDNGTGMSSEIITNNWMTIGRSTKTKRFTSKKGRIQTGAKGIGRFALDRLGESSAMLTKTSFGSKFTNILWEVNWEDFEKKSNITEVNAELYETTITFEDFIESECKNVDLKKFVNNNFKGTGTIFRVDNLRDDWNRKGFLESIEKQLSSLVPKNLSEVFNVYFFYDNKSISEAKIQSPEVNDFDYKIDFEVIEKKEDTVLEEEVRKEDKTLGDDEKKEDKTLGDDEKKEVTISIWREEFEFGEEFETIIKEAGFTQEDSKYFRGEPIKFTLPFSDMFSTREPVVNTIGNFTGTIYFSKTTSYEKDKEKYYYKERKYEKQNSVFSGIKIFRDHFRVRPYGEYGSSSFDWLMLSPRKQKSPAAPSHPTGTWRVSSDQINGSIFISRLNIHLPDTSNREGIIETDEFLIFKDFLVKVISYFERDRQYVFRKLNEYYDKVNQHAKIEKEIQEKANWDKVYKEQFKTAKQDSDIRENKEPVLLPESSTVNASDAQLVIEHKESLIKNLEDENKMLRALATTGIVTNTYIHEIKGITHDLSMDIVDAYEELNDAKNVNNAIMSLKDALNHKKSLTSWFEITLESVKKDKRNWKKNNLIDLLDTLVNRWERVLKNKEIIINFNKSEEEIEFYCHSFEFESIFNNLLTNSVSAFSLQINDNKVITLDIYSDDNWVYIQYNDNGPGLPESTFKKNPKEILKAFISEKKDVAGEEIGTGMGMWIIDNTIKDYKGTLSLEKNIESQVGFYADITLPKGNRK